MFLRCCGQRARQTQRASQEARGRALCPASGGRADLDLAPGWFARSVSASWACRLKATFLGASDVSPWWEAAVVASLGFPGPGGVAAANRGSVRWAAGTLHSQPCGRKHLQPREQSRWAGPQTQTAKLKMSVRLRHAAPGSGVPCPSSLCGTPFTYRVLPSGGPWRPGLPCTRTVDAPLKCAVLDIN